MDAIFIDAKKWGGRGEKGLMFANCFGEKLGKILFFFLGVQVSILLRRRQDKKKGTLYMF
jgi:hypothetical protein